MYRTPEPIAMPANNAIHMSSSSGSSSIVTFRRFRLVCQGKFHRPLFPENSVLCHAKKPNIPGPLPFSWSLRLNSWSAHDPPSQSKMSQLPPQRSVLANSSSRFRSRWRRVHFLLDSIRHNINSRRFWSVRYQVVLEEGHHVARAGIDAGVGPGKCALAAMRRSWRVLL
jgi:hypothetical protein